jgi:hypothetical protein
MLSRTADHIWFSATYPRAALWPRTTICAEAKPVEARVMVVRRKKARRYEDVIVASTVRNAF